MEAALHAMHHFQNGGASRSGTDSKSGAEEEEGKRELGAEGGKEREKGSGRGNHSLTGHVRNGMAVSTRGPRPLATWVGAFYRVPSINDNPSEWIKGIIYRGVHS